VQLPFLSLQSFFIIAGVLGFGGIMLQFGKKMLITLMLISLGCMNLSCNTMQGAG